jgi:hypothetical protein
VAAGAPTPIINAITSAAIAQRSVVIRRATQRGSARTALVEQRARVGGLRQLHAERVSASTSAGLAAFYAGLERALAQMEANPTQEASQASLWPLQAQNTGVLSRNAAVALGAALLAVALLLGFALLPRLAAAGFLPMSRSSAQVMRESLVLTLGAVAVCLFLAVLLLREAI